MWKLQKNTLPNLLVMIPVTGRVSEFGEYLKQ